MNPTTPPGNTPGFFGQKVSIPGIDVNSAGDNQLILKDDYSSRIYYNSNGVPTVLLGLRTAVTPNQQGLYVSQDGVDVTQATDSQLIFNSNQDIFKIVESGNLTLPSYSLAAGQLRADLITIPHNLNYAPVLNAYALVNYYVIQGATFVGAPATISTISAYVALPYLLGSGDTLKDTNISNYVISASVDATNVYFNYLYITTSAGSGGTGYNFPTVPIKYYLLQESAAK